MAEEADKLVNAVLRQLTNKPLPDIKSIKRKNKYYAVAYSVPVWLVKKLIDQFGEERAVAIMESLFVRSRASIRVTDLTKLDEIKQATGSEQSLLARTGLTRELAILLPAVISSMGTLRSKMRPVS